MVTDTGGINDQSFNQSAWEGLQEVSNETGAEIGYLESKQQAEYPTNLDKQVDSGNQLIWGNGYTVGDATLNAAEMNPDVLFGVNDLAFEERPAEEVTEMWYAERMAPDGVKVFNPAFDVTDNDLIAGIITEYGIARAPYTESLKEIFRLKQEAPRCHGNQFSRSKTHN